MNDWILLFKFHKPITDIRKTGTTTKIDTKPIFIRMKGKRMNHIFPFPRSIILRTNILFPSFYFSYVHHLPIVCVCVYHESRRIVSGHSFSSCRRHRYCCCFFSFSCSLALVQIPSISDYSSSSIMRGWKYRHCVQSNTQWTHNENEKKNETRAIEKHFP